MPLPIVRCRGWLKPGMAGLLAGGLVLFLAGAAPAESPAGASVTRRAATVSVHDRPDRGVVRWQWPLPGKVMLGFDPRTPGRRGVHIGGKAGQTVRAAAAGRVAYVGDGLPGYGRLIILQHPGDLLSAYRNLGGILVKTGAPVQAGQAIGKLGAGRGGAPILHFEILRNRRPVDPLIFLPRRGGTAAVW